MESRQVLFYAAVLFLSVTLGFSIESQFSRDDRVQKFNSFPSVKVDSERQIRTLSFDNNSLNLMLEDSEEARFFIDKNRDGSFDIELNNLTRDGEEHESSQVVTFGRKSYRLYFIYLDDSGVAGDAYLEVYQISRI